MKFCFSEHSGLVVRSSASSVSLFPAQRPYALSEVFRGFSYPLQLNGGVIYLKEVKTATVTSVQIRNSLSPFCQTLYNL
jgi:hypothetical protein